MDCCYARQSVVFPPYGDSGYLSIQLGRTISLFARDGNQDRSLRIHTVPLEVGLYGF
jgi:hypothetical protein